MSAGTERLRERLRRNLAGEGVGIASVCSAHPFVLRAALADARARGGVALIEATCNQVNHQGGYTGMDPAGFRDLVYAEADAIGLPRELVVLGGDHLGPNPWRDRPAETAMAEARAMVAAYVRAGFAKIHLDASMGCAGEQEPLAPEAIAARAAELCAVAEASAPDGRAPVYVIGTEVPPPGGATEAMDHLSVTRPEALRRTVELHRAAFAARGLDAAFGRVAAVVVQPGVEFGQSEVAVFEPDRARALSRCAEGPGGVPFEAHSTDYQPESALRALVQGHFAILKVGPELSFAMREAIYALDAIEAELLPREDRAGLRGIVERAMLAEPRWWAGHYGGDEAAQRLARSYSLSDRIRYYWTRPEAAAALDRLLGNLRRAPIPPALVSQYLPVQHAALRDGRIGADPAALIGDRIVQVLGRYARACGIA